jgi:RNA recognition motif-containing protein
MLSGMNAAPESVLSNQLFIRNLSFHCKQHDIRSLFARKKIPIRSADIQLGEAGLSRYFGTITLENEEDISRAIECFDGLLFQGRYIRVEKYSSQAGVERRRSENCCQLHISFKQRERSNSSKKKNKRMRIGEREIREILTQYGTVIDVVIKYYVIDRAGKHGGFAFAQLQQMPSVYRAIAGLNDLVIDGIHWELKLSETFLRRQSCPVAIAQVDRDSTDEKDDGNFYDESVNFHPQVLPMFPCRNLSLPYAMCPYQPYVVDQGVPNFAPPPPLFQSPLLTRVDDGAVVLPTAAMPLMPMMNVHYPPYPLLSSNLYNANAYAYGSNGDPNSVMQEATYYDYGDDTFTQTQS